MDEPLKIPRLHWQADMPEGRSPFCRNESRAIKITLHSSGLKVLPPNEQDAYNLLLEFGQLPELDMLQFEAGDYPYVQFVDGDEIHIDLPEGGWRKHGVNTDLVRRLSGTDNRDHPKYQTYRALEAHSELGRDIFVSGSTDLQSIRDNYGHYNIRTPSESLRIIGLLLRSRDNWIVGGKGSSWSVDRRGFYWISMRLKLPAMWKYNAECREVGGFDGALTTLVSSVMERCYTLTQVVDELGKEFFGNGDHEAILYHFNYFSLLLTGVFDAQARIAYEVFGIEGSKRSAGFNMESKERFGKRLKLKAPYLHDLVSRPENKAVINIVHLLRNTIHGSGHSAQQESVPTPKIHVALSSDVGEDIWKNARVIRCDSSYGLVRRDFEHYSINGIDQGKRTEFIVEPYNFSSFILDRAFKLINEVAEKTDVATQKKLPLRSHPIPANWHELARRIELLSNTIGVRSCVSVESH